ncbi:MAG: VOC family protein [Myxococcota bacterium]|nr:VOC family protein [Myxococcota bacterium]
MTPDPLSLPERSRLTHIAVRTRDVEASIDFYRRYAGFSITQDRTDDEIRVVWMAFTDEDPDFVIVLLAMPHEPLREPAATDHYGFDCDSRADVDRIGELARREGCLKYGPIDAGPIVGYIVMVRDPSGNTCEFSHGQAIRTGKPGERGSPAS